MDQQCPQGNHPTHTTAVKFQALLTWDSWDEPSAHSEKTPVQFKPLHSLRSKNGGTFDKKTRKEKKKDRR